MQQSETIVHFRSSDNLEVGEHEHVKGYDVAIVPVYTDGDDNPTGNVALDAYIAVQMFKRDHKATRASVLTLTAPHDLDLTGELKLKDLLVVGMGKKDAPIGTAEMNTIGKAVVKSLGKDKTAVVLGAEKESIALADAVLRSSYVYDKEKSGLEGDKPSKLHIDFAVANPGCKAKAFEPQKITTLASQWAANLANKPSNRLTPGAYARKIETTLKPLGVEVTVISEESNDTTFRRMGGLLAVGKASMSLRSDTMYLDGRQLENARRKPHAVIMEYDGTGGREGVKPVVLIGKGVTFDSGGISLKPGANMGDMKMDMHGSATVVATMRALAAMKAPVKVNAIVGLVENMPGAAATKPGDVIRHFNGKTSEIDNTDAEGRLVLFDCMALAQERWGADNIAAMADVATLTGAIVSALDKDYAGMFSNDDALAAELDAAGKATNNEVWRMPLTEKYFKAVQAGKADLKNSGVKGPGSSTAAAYLWHALEKKDSFPWAHLDIAGVAWGDDKTATGYGVHLLTKWIMDNHATGDQKSVCSKPECKENGCHPKP